MAYYNSEECFRRYELVIASALKSYPTPVRFKGTGRKASTDSARCADAIGSYRKHSWATTDPIFTSFADKPLRVRVERSTTTGEEEIVVGPPVARGSEDVINLLQTSSAANEQHDSIRMVPTTEQHILQIMSMIDSTVIQDAVQIEIKWLEVVERLAPDFFNLAHRTDHSHIYLY